MRHPSSTSLRVLRSLVALMTVWCTGCAGFDPVMDAMFGAAPAVIRAADAATDGASPRVESSAMDSHAQFSCGCTSCHAVALGASAFTPVASLARGPEAGRVLPLTSVGRVPLHPPPQVSS